MKRRILGVVLLGLSAAGFLLSFNADPREYAYGLLAAAYLLFVLAVFTMVARAPRSSRITRAAERR